MLLTQYNGIVVKQKEEVMNGKGLNDMRGVVHIFAIIVIAVIVVLLLLFVLHAGPWHVTPPKVIGTPT